MSRQETRIVTSMIANSAIFIVYFVIVLGMYQDGRFDGDDAARLVGQSVLILIGAQIVGNIVVAILVAIGRAIVTGKEEEPDITDERDKLIELRALRLSFILFGAAFVGTVTALALGVTYFTAFQMIIVSLAIADFIGNILRLVRYRRGF